MNNTQKRNPSRTRTAILAAARTEFANKGLDGARVDEIAQRSGLNKRMIYHYFGSKEELFSHVVEDTYLDIRTAEQALDLDNKPAREALEALIRFTWDYYLQNPVFITIVNSENLHQACHLKYMTSVIEANRLYISTVKNLLERGVREGVFRSAVDPVQLNITVAAIGYYYITNRHTGSILFERDLMSPEAQAERLEFNIDTILRLVSRGAL